MSKQIVVGKGPVGTATAAFLAEQGHDVRVASRSGGRSDIDGVQHVTLDATDATGLAALATGADALYNCVNPAYHRWATDWPPMANAMLDAAERSGAVLVTMGNLYGYGPVDRPMTEDLPLAATGTKGRVRVRMWEDSLARHRAGRVRVTEARASDYVGPGVTHQGYLGERAVPLLLRGRTVRVLGDPDAPHSWTYVPDVARTLVRLGTDPRAWGRAWHVPTALPASGRDMVTGLCAAAEVAPVKVRRIPPLALRVSGLFVPMMRELQETRHQFERPFVLDSSAYTATFGESATPLDEALKTTVAWWRERLGHTGTARTA